MAKYHFLWLVTCISFESRHNAMRLSLICVESLHEYMYMAAYLQP